MDAIPNPPTAGQVRLVPVELIDAADEHARRVAVATAGIDSMARSIQRRGMLQPIGLRPHGNRYRIAFGRRRLAGVRALGQPEILAMVGDWTDAELAAVRAAENMQREALHPIDRWLSVRDLVDQGYSIPDAAAELGLDDRTARQMERLGRLAPELIKLIEIEMPNDHQLRTIALAPPATQKSAAKGKVVTRLPDGRQVVDWHIIAPKCAVTQISKRHAIFDPDAHPDLWEEDLFAEPGDPDRISTRDVGKFMSLQQAALDVRIEAARAAKQRILPAQYSASMPWPGVALPKGWTVASNRPPEGGFRPTRIECVFTAVHPNGSIIEVLGVDAAARKAADKAAQDRQKARAAAAKTTHSETEDEDDPDAGDPDAGGDDTPTPETAKPGITEAGLKVIAEAKTLALQTTLRESISELPLEQVIALLLLTFTADNVRVQSGYERKLEWDDREHRDFRDIKRALLAPGGGIATLSSADARAHAGEMLARILAVSGPDDDKRSAAYTSGDAAEWIGAAIGAGSALGRFDTAAFLATVTGERLIGAAKAAGIKSSGPHAALRERLVGKLPEWRPDAAPFGAPTPR